MIPMFNRKPETPASPKTIEGWLMGGPDDGRTVNVGIEETEYVTLDGEVYLRRPRVEDVINPLGHQSGPRLIAAWFDHIIPLVEMCHCAARRPIHTYDEIGMEGFTRHMCEPCSTVRCDVEGRCPE